MSRSFGLVDYKVQEAEYFLEQLIEKGKGFNFSAVQYIASAFATAARSVTFAMQSSLKGNERFDLWYALRQEELRSNRLARFFHDFRTVTNHIGDNVVKAGAGGGGEIYYYFMPCHDLPEVPSTDVVSTCREHFVQILELVYKCYVHMGPIVHGQLYFTESHFTSLGKTIEDAEVELGLPRGYTDIGKPELNAERWRLLRRQADGCLIDGQFRRWLGKVVPTEADIPSAAS